MADNGKNKRKQIEAYDSLHNRTLLVDSMEEVDFCNWLCEAAQLSIINDFIYQPPSFNLFNGETYTTVDGKQRCLFRDHIYSPDFLITFNSNQLELAREFKVQKHELSSELSVYIDVKGAFAGHDGGRSFSLNQKWIWSVFKVYIHKLIPKIFCKKFGVPQKSIYSDKTKKPRKIFQGFKSIKHIFGLE